MSRETESALSGKKPKVGKVKVKNEEFERCEQEGKCFECFKEGSEIKYKECPKHNRNLTTVSAKIVSVSRYNDYLNACSATRNMSEGNKYEETIWYKENSEEEQDVKVCKIGSVILVDSGAAFTSVNESIKLHQNIRGTRLEYADESVGTEIKTKGNVVLNGNKVPAYVSPDLSQNLLSIPQIDRCLGGATIQFSSRSVTFIPDENQKHFLKEICENVSKENMIMDAKLNVDGLYAADTSHMSKSNIVVFPRIECSTLAQAVYFLHCSLGHMPTSSLIYLTKDGCGERKMINNWPKSITSEVIMRNYHQCKACLTVPKSPFSAYSYWQN